MTFDTPSLFAEVEGGAASPVGADAPSTSDLPLDAPVRASDPDTSAFAARTLDAANDRALVLDALRALGGNGTADDVWDELDRSQPSRRWQRSCVSSRLSQLKDPKRYAGELPVVDTGERVVGPTGRPVIVFAVTA